MKVNESGDQLKTALIACDNISFAYPGAPPVFQDFSFSFYRGERIGLSGPIGSGKSTILKLIMGLLKPLTGVITIFNKPRIYEKDFREVRRRIGYLFQNPDDQLFCPTVAEDIAFGPLNLGATPDQAHTIVHETLDLLDLHEYENRISYRLSGGEKRLVSLATIIAMKPEILLLDEPTTGLDDHYMHRVLNFLQACTSPYIAVSHDTQFLRDVTDRVYELHNGRLVLLNAS